MCRKEEIFKYNFYQVKDYMYKHFTFRVWVNIQHFFVLISYMFVGIVYFQQPIVLSYKKCICKSKASIHYYLVKMYYNTRGRCIFTIILTNEVTNLGAISI